MLIEDDEVDILSTVRAFNELSIPNELVVAKNGEEALEQLQISNDKLPGIILLDLNMPKMNGVEFLKHLKANEHLKKIPVVVLTTSSSKQDVNLSFENYAAGYMVKPMDYEKFRDLIEKIYNYWLKSELPV